jgi:4-aminobutyrate aminotransferase-like enzyme
MGNYLMDNVRELSKDFEFIGDVRGSGLFIGVEFVTDRESQNPATEMTSELMEFARERGVFLSCDGPGNNVLKIKPPLVVNQSDIDLFLAVLADGLRAARS